jgi:ABC-type glycerol-3-phosphate transport system substrate-binding protein
MATAEAETSHDEQVPPGGLDYDGFISYSHAADDLLAPRLQTGLQRFAKPWWKRRALRIFRDESSLSANPHLWSSITDALDQSDWFVLLLSPDAADSEWVNQEVEYWLEHKDPGRIIPVVTDGDFTWTDGDFVSDAAPPALRGAFSNEPRWVDLRFAGSEEQLDLNNPRFSAAVADIASAVRGVPKDELESEEVRQHRRTVRTAWGTGAGLLILALLAGGAALFALDQRNAAVANATRADQQATIAQARHLTAQALLQLTDDPELATMLAVESMRATADSGVVLPAALDSVHASLQSAGVQYPFTDAPVAVRPGLGAPFGVYVMPPHEVADLAQTVMTRPFSDEECDAYFTRELCPDPRDPISSRVAIEGGTDSYIGEATAIPLAGTTVTIAGNWSELEAEGFEAALAPIAERSGINIVYLSERGGDDPSDTAGRGESDIVVLPWIGDLAELAGDGRLMDLTQYLDRDAMVDSYGDYLVSLASVDSDGGWPSDSGGVHGIWLKLTAKSLIWHPSPEFENAGYLPPTSWAELRQLSDRIVADGRTPWCLGSRWGWPATDWVEWFVLSGEGPEFYDQWASHQIPFDHPAVVQAVERMGELAFTPGYVAPGPQAIPDIAFLQLTLSLGVDPPPCWMLPQGSYAPAQGDSLEAGGNIDVFRFPALDPSHTDSITGAADVAVAVADRPEVREVMEALNSPEFGVEWSAIDAGYIPANRLFDPNHLDNAVERRLTELTLKALSSDKFRFDASDLMPVLVNDAFNSGMLSYFLAGPGSADEILADIEAVWATLEGAG